MKTKTSVIETALEELKAEDPTYERMVKDTIPEDTYTYRAGSGAELAEEQRLTVEKLGRKIKVKKGVKSLGQIHKDISNAIIILKNDPEYGKRLRMSEMGDRIFLGDEEVKDSFITITRAYICEKYLGLDFSEPNMKAAIFAVAYENRFHPAREAYEQLPQWDGIRRIHTCPQRLLHAGDNQIFGFYYARTMIAAVARAYQPGCKMDTCMIFAGPQGTFKSTFFSLWVLKPDFYSCSKMDIKDKDGRLNLHYTQVSELAEIDRLISRISDDALLKDYISDPKDLFRAPYAPAPSFHPRSCIMVGTCNPEEGILRDPTGDRRYWVIPIGGKIDTKGFLEEREQQWAEALHYYRQGEQWYLTDAEEAEREVQSAKYRVEDPLEEEVIRCIEEIKKSTKFVMKEGGMGESIPAYSTRNGIHTNEILIMVNPRIKAYAQAIARIMKKLGWTKKDILINGVRTQRWLEPNTKEQA